MLTNLNRLEESYFHKIDEEQLQSLKRDLTHQQNVDQIKAETKIQDEGLLEKLASIGVSSYSLLALKLIPLIQMSLMDGVIDPKEREEILHYIQKQDLVSHSEALSHFEGWLEHHSIKDLYGLWKECIQDMRAHLDSENFQKLKTEILKESYAVANADNSFWGVGRKVSGDEKKLLEDIEKTFEG